eukprot:TRINITY_DN9976_c0_g1_i3.p1 TRINITY_DN9976_c0_g1~~TRINITY_DN9976_c0_g1_i3.p1  ORF type:complete len:191 (+),score=38.78 TRINITY_DN9976_c0_g1_i3:90-662(+)
MIRRPPRSTLSSSSAASDVYKRQDWDLKTMLPAQLRHSRGSACPKYFYHWINLKTAMSTAFAKKRISGMEDMLRHYNLPLIGRHHSGIDDCRNIAAVLMQMLKTGVAVDITTTSQTVAKDSIPAIRRRAAGAPAQVSSFPQLHSILSSQRPPSLEPILLLLLHLHPLSPLTSLLLLLMIERREVRPLHLR